jgi:hypothetical protein
VSDNTDPVASMTIGRDLRDAQHWRFILSLLVREIERQDGFSDGNAPGHGHEIPGVWDSDNGPLAGEPCAWCALWNTARRALATAPGDVASSEPGGVGVARSSDEVSQMLMGQAQTFASAWSLVGGCFDFGDALANARREERHLGILIDGALAAARLGLLAPVSQSHGDGGSARPEKESAA